MNNLSNKTPNLIQRLFGRLQPPAPQPLEAAQPAAVSDTADPAEIEKQLKRLSKELYKWNTLAETQVTQQRQSFEQALAQSRDSLELLRQDRDALATRERLSLIKALFPVIDSIEAALTSGRAQIATLQVSAPEAADVLAGWLEGQRLLLDRLLALLEADGVRSIPAVSESFDPYLHVALKTVSDPTKPPGLILAEERHGYRWNTEILRFAEVVVNKPAAPAAENVPSVQFQAPEFDTP